MFKRNLYQRFHNVIQELIDINREHTKKSKSCHIGSCMYSSERNTIHVNIGRQAGYSTYIAKTANATSLVITGTSTGKYIKKLAKGKKLHILTTRQLLNGAHRGLDYDTVYVDNPSDSLKNMSLAKLREMLTLGPKYKPLFILLGS